MEKKLSQMMLDNKISGRINQWEGVVYLFEEDESEGTYDAAIATIDALNEVTDALQRHMARLT